MPFKSDKQRRWMYANKPELAKKWSATYKFLGGDIEGIDEFGVDVEEQLPTGARIPLETQELVGSFVPGIGTAVGLRDAAKDYEEGNWGNLALTGGLSLLGPLGSAANKRIQGARKGLGFTDRFNPKPGRAKEVGKVFDKKLGREVPKYAGLSPHQSKEVAQGLYGKDLDLAVEIAKDINYEAANPTKAIGNAMTRKPVRIRERLGKRYPEYDYKRYELHPDVAGENKFVHNFFSDAVNPKTGQNLGPRATQTLGGTGPIPTPLRDPRDAVPTFGGVDRPSGNFALVTQNMRKEGVPGPEENLMEALVRTGVLKKKGG